MEALIFLSHFFLSGRSGVTGMMIEARSTFEHYIRHSHIFNSQIYVMAPKRVPLMTMLRSSRAPAPPVPNRDNVGTLRAKPALIFPIEPPTNRFQAND